MIGIGTKLFDIDGSFAFQNNQMALNDINTATAKRRLSKVKTLDGGVFIDDSGYAVGDNDINVTVVNPSESLYQKLKNIFVYHGYVYITSIDGNFLCVPSDISMKNGNAVMTFFTQENA